jgi:hypothetical protein
MTATNQQRFTGDDRHASMLNFIRQTADFITNPRQASYWRGLASCAHPVRVVSAYEVWSANEVAMLKLAVSPAKNECYRVASLLSHVTSGRARYVEGQYWINILGVDHAFNYVADKDVYVDFTAEFALGKDPSQGAYIAFRDFDDETIWRIICENEYYGNIYNEVWLQENKARDNL